MRIKVVQVVQVTHLHRHLALLRLTLPHKQVIAEHVEILMEVEIILPLAGQTSTLLQTQGQLHAPQIYATHLNAARSNIEPVVTWMVMGLSTAHARILTF